MFKKKREREDVLEKLREVKKEAQAPLNPIKHAYKQQQLFFTCVDILEQILEGKL